MQATPTMADEERLLDKYGKIHIMRTLFWSCPTKFVPDSVWSFLRQRTFYERHSSAPFPALEDISPRYLQAEAIFDLEYTRYLTDER